MTLARTTLAALVALLGACHTDGVTPVDTDGETDDTEVPCAGLVVSTTPLADAVDWFWLDPLVVVVSEPTEGWEVHVVDDEGTELPTTVTVDDTGLRLTVAVTGGLRPATRHVLRVTDCEGLHEVPFTTSDYGLPIEGGAATLDDRTWKLDLIHADWVEPRGFGPLLASLLDNPFLIGTEAADATTLDLIGAFGTSNGEVIVQDTSYPSWDIPPEGFDAPPWFDVEAAHLTWVLGSWPVPISSFGMTGTFAPDGRTIGGMTVTGLLDSRNLGGAIGADDEPAAICGFVDDLGIHCVPCDDGEPWCMELDVRALIAVEQRGVVLTPSPAE